MDYTFKTVYTLRYDKQVCSRCGGSGSYSYNSIDGSRCYGCQGRKWQNSKAGKAAAAKVQAFIAERHTVPVEALQPGDLVKHDGYTRVVASAVISDEARFGSTVDGVTTWKNGVTVTFTKPVPSQFGAYSSYSTSVGSTVVKGVTGAAWDEVVAFARTIKKGVTVEEKQVPVAQEATAGLDLGGAQ